MVHVSKNCQSYSLLTWNTCWKEMKFIFFMKSFCPSGSQCIIWYNSRFRGRKIHVSGVLLFWISFFIEMLIFIFTCLFWSNMTSFIWKWAHWHLLKSWMILKLNAHKNIAFVATFKYHSDITCCLPMFFFVTKLHSRYFVLNSQQQLLVGLQSHNFFHIDINIKSVAKTESIYLSLCYRYWKNTEVGSQICINVVWKWSRILPGCDLEM